MNLDNKQTLWVFVGTDKCKLTHNQIRVYSYLLYQARYGSSPPTGKVAHYTGLDERTIKSCVKTLTDLGLFADGIAVLPPDKADWFRHRRQSGGDHASQQLLTWQSWVRATGGPLTVAAVSIYSYVYSTIKSKFTPRYGWSVPYLARVLSLDDNTVDRACKLLAEYGYVAMYSRHPFIFKIKPTPDHLECLAEKSAYKATVATGFVGFDGDQPNAKMGLGTFDPDDPKPETAPSTKPVTKPSTPQPEDRLKVFDGEKFVETSNGRAHLEQIEREEAMQAAILTRTAADSYGMMMYLNRVLATLIKPEDRELIYNTLYKQAVDHKLEGWRERYLELALSKGYQLVS